MMRVFIILLTIICGSAGLAYCSQDGLPAMDETRYFSGNYAEAREKFLETSRRVGASLESFKHPNKGPAGEPLYTDVALTGSRDSKSILVLVSGTHGVEGFAGSGIQTGLLQEGIASSLMQDMSILMIHAINPYGFAYLRRFNEDNVDLNRNFADHSKPYPLNPGYEELSKTLSPKSISFWANVKALFRLLLYRLMNGKTQLKVAVSGGQYSDPQGIFYGGRKETWSNKTIRTIAKRYLSKAERVVFIDFHTGLGPYGNAEVILNEKEYSATYKRAVQWWGNIARTSASGKSVSVHLQTTMKLAIPKMLPDTEVTAVTLEFGTYSPLKVLWALREENWLYNHGTEGYPGGSKIKMNLLRVFYPDDDRWKLKVWKHGKKVVEQALSHL